MTRRRHEWVDYSKGICILGVVTLYAAQKMSEELGVTGWMQAWVDFAQPFRMPDFFLLSGLFLAKTIDRPWRQYLDSKVVHYLYFYLLWTFIYFVAKLVVGRSGDSVQDWAADLGGMVVQGFAMLWFIAVLPMFFVATRLTKRIPVWIMLPAAALLQGSDLHWDQWQLVGHFCDRFLYFYVGYRFAPWFFRLAQASDQNVRWAILGIALWGMANQWLVSEGLAMRPGISILTGLSGSSAVIALGALLSRQRSARFVRYLGEHSIVTYLAFFLPMGILIVALRRHGLPADPGTVAAFLSAISILAALALFWLVRRTQARFLFERPACATLARPDDRARRGAIGPLTAVDRIRS